MSIGRFYQDWETSFRNLEDLFQTMNNDPQLALQKISSMFEEAADKLRDLKNDWLENADQYKQELIDKYGEEEGLERFNELDQAIQNLDPSVFNQLQQVWDDYIDNPDISKEQLEETIQAVGDQMTQIIANNPDMTHAEIQQAFYQTLYEVMQDRELTHEHASASLSSQNLTTELQNHLDGNEHLTNHNDLITLKEVTVEGASALSDVFQAHALGHGTSIHAGLETNLRSEAEPATHKPDIKGEPGLDIA